MTLIDLGEVGFHEPADPSPPPVPRWLRFLDFPSRRKASAAAALAILAGALAGTAPDAGPIPRLRTIPSVNEGSPFWAVDGVGVQYKMEGGAVSAIDLDSGQVLWSTNWANAITQVQPGPDGTALLQTVSDAAATGPERIVTESGATIFEPAYSQDTYNRRLAAAATVTVLDMRTGAQRLSRPGTLLSPWGTPDLVILEPGSQGSAGLRMTKVDIRDGHDLWTQPMPEGMRWTFAYGDDSAPYAGGLLLMDSRNGSVMSVSTGGQVIPHGRVKPGANLEWTWSDYVAISYPGTARRTDEPPLIHFELHDLRTLSAKPLWTRDVDPRSGATPWPCGKKDRLCEADGGLLYEIGIQDGASLGAREEEPGRFFFSPDAPNMFGMWTVVNRWVDDDQALAAIPPSISKTGVGWLGLVRMRDGKPSVTPLMQIPLQITSCLPADETWIVCNGLQPDGTTWDRSLILRKSDLDELAGRLGAP